VIGILNYGMGNLRSVANALAFLGIDFSFITKAEEIRRMNKLIVPGVGAFGAGMKNLATLGFLPVLQEEVVDKKKPILGICLGMQLFAERGFENGDHEGLGWIPGVVRRLENQDSFLKVPHMGWNDVRLTKESPLFEGIAPHSDFYFVHSYFFDCQPQAISSVCQYGRDFPASVEWQNIYGTQFHPEKSQDAGLMLLQNFVRREMN
jgi:glutamine amidotransferase